MTGVSGRRRGVRGGSLVLISVLLFGSAILRLGVEAGPAVSRGISHSDEDRQSGTPVMVTGNADMESLQPMLAAFQAREKKISDQETRILDRLKALSIAEIAIDKKLVELARAEEQLRQTLALADGASEGDLSQLTGVYEKMKPKQAAVLFEQMDPEFAAGFLARMHPEMAAKILAGINPQSAYAISVIFAGRNANVPKN